MAKFLTLFAFLIVSCQSTSTFKWKRKNGSAFNQPTTPIKPKMTLVRRRKPQNSDRDHINYEGKLEYQLTKQWDLGYRNIVDSFVAEVLEPEIPLTSNTLFGPVLDTITRNPCPRYVKIADSLWKYAQRDIHSVKPCQVVYSKMMKVYSAPLKVSRTSYNNEARGSFIQKASDLVNQWIYEYQNDKRSLQGHLYVLDVNSPVIINQMLRLLHDWRPAFQALGFESRKDAMLHFVNKLADLGIYPDDSTEDMLKTVHAQIPVEFYVNLMRSARTVHSFEEAVEYVIREVKNGKFYLPRLLRRTKNQEDGGVNESSEKIQESFESWIRTNVRKLFWQTPNRKIFDFLVHDLRADIRPDFCVKMIKLAHSLEAIDFVLENMLFQVIEKRAFVRFDVLNDQAITTKIRNIEPIDQSWLYAFRLHYIGQNTFPKTSNVSDPLRAVSAPEPRMNSPGPY